MFKIPKIDTTPKKTGGIQYPHVSTWDVFKEYAKLTGPYWWLVLLVLMGVAAAILSVNVIGPLFYKKFFDLLTQIAGQNSVVITPLFDIIFIILGLNIISWIGWRLSWFTAPYLQGHVMAKALQRSYEYTTGHSYSFFTNVFTGSLTQKIHRFARSYEVLFDNIFFDLYQLFLKIVGSILILYLSHPILAYAMGVWIVAFLCVSFFFSRMKLKYDVEAAAMNSRLTGALADSLSNHNAIQSFSGYEEEARRVKAINIPFMHLNIFRWQFGSAIDAAQSLLGIAIEFFVFYYGIKYWNSGLITLGTFVLVQAYIASIGNSLWGFSRVVRNIYQGVADAKEMVEILHLKHEIVDAPGAKDVVVDKGAVEFKDVKFGFGKKAEEIRYVFDGINISIKPGEKVAFIGSSGAGKSTLVKLLMRLYDIQGGKIFVDGQNIKEVTQKSLRDNISLVPQDPALFHRTLMENIRYGRRDATDEEVIRAAKLAHCDVFINEFPQKYETFVGERGVKLSGGERQRVAIARAILKNAPILVLDEATSSLDSHSESLIQDALHTLMEGKTTIVIAHRLSTIRNMDRIVVVSKGGVVEEGSHDELIKKPDGVYAKLWSLQAGGFAGKSIEELLEV